MATYEVTKKGEISCSGYFKEIFFIRRKIFGIPFYNIDIMGETPLGLLSGIILLVLTIVFSVYTLAGWMSIFYPLTLIPSWYSWHLICKRIYYDVDDAKTWIESKLKCNLLQKNNIVLKYVSKKNTIEVDKFLN